MAKLTDQLLEHLFDEIWEGSLIYPEYVALIVSKDWRSAARVTKKIAETTGVEPFWNITNKRDSSLFIFDSGPFLTVTNKNSPEHDELVSICRDYAIWWLDVDKEPTWYSLLWKDIKNLFATEDYVPE